MSIPMENIQNEIPNSSLDKALRLLQAIIMDQAQHSLSHIAASTGIPKATAYRIAAALSARGLIVSGARGHFVPGALLLVAMAGQRRGSILAHVATPFLKRIARMTRQVAHLGLLEDDMVTYIVKEGSGSASQFTRAHTQLDAYCSGLGKVLLAYLPSRRLDEYLAHGTFFKLTANTVTSPAKFRMQLAQIRRRGYSLDEGEFAEDLRCVAVPVTDQNGEVCAAISISGSIRLLERGGLKKSVELLQVAARGIEKSLYRPVTGVEHPTSMR